MWATGTLAHVLALLYHVRFIYVYSLFSSVPGYLCIFFLLYILGNTFLTSIILLRFVVYENTLSVDQDVYIQ